MRGTYEGFLELECFLEIDVVGGHRPNGSRAGAFLKLETSIWSPLFDCATGLLRERLTIYREALADGSSAEDGRVSRAESDGSSMAGPLLTTE